MTSRSRRAAAAIGLVVLLIGSFLLGRSAAPPIGDEVGGPTPPISTARSERGAVQAATDLARVLPGPSGDVEAYYTAMSDLAAPDWRERAQELAENAVVFVQDRYGDGGRVSFRPMMYRVQSFTSDEAEIDIWGVVVATSSEDSAIEESWLTATLNLVWLDDQWKVNGQSSRSGPTPELLQGEDQVSADELRSFEEYESVGSP